MVQVVRIDACQRDAKRIVGGELFGLGRRPGVRSSASKNVLRMIKPPGNLPPCTCVIDKSFSVDKQVSEELCECSPLFRDIRDAVHCCATFCSSFFGANFPRDAKRTVGGQLFGLARRFGARSSVSMNVLRMTKPPGNSPPCTCAPVKSFCIGKQVLGKFCERSPLSKGIVVALNCGATFCSPFFGAKSPREAKRTAGGQLLALARLFGAWSSTSMNVLRMTKPTGNSRSRTCTAYDVCGAFSAKAEAATPFGRPYEEVLDVSAHRLMDADAPFEFVALGKPFSLWYWPDPSVFCEKTGGKNLGACNEC